MLLGIYYLIVLVVEFFLVLACIFALPQMLVRHPSRRWQRWGVGLGALALFAIVFHGKQIAAQALIWAEHEPQRFVTRSEAYCQGFDLVYPSNAPVEFENERDSVDGQVWRYRGPEVRIDTFNECGPRCAAWAQSGLARELYVGTRGYDLRFPYGSEGDHLAILRRVEILETDACSSAIAAQLRGLPLPTYLDQHSPPTETDLTVRWDEACVIYSSEAPTPPLVLNIIEEVPRDIGLGLTRASYATALIEHFSGEVLARSEMTVIRGAAPTLLPTYHWQHVSKGQLLSSNDLHGWYRETNCGAVDESQP